MQGGRPGRGHREGRGWGQCVGGTGRALDRAEAVGRVQKEGLVPHPH